MKKKVLPVIVAILLILVIGGCALGKVLLDKYSYSKEEADWNEFYQVSENDRSAIILQNEMVEEQALIKDGVCYFDLATVHKYLNEVFYADMTENLLLYATPTEVIRTTFGETAYTTTEGTQEAGYVISFTDEFPPLRLVSPPGTAPSGGAGRDRCRSSSRTRCSR